MDFTLPGVDTPVSGMNQSCLNRVILDFEYSLSNICEY